MREAFVKTIKRFGAGIRAEGNSGYTLTVRNSRFRYAASVRLRDGLFEHYNNIHPLGARLRLATRVKKAAGREDDRENAVDTRCRPREGRMSTVSIGSRSPRAHSASPDASATGDHP
jgi:hypothetical protein